MDWKVVIAELRRLAHLLITSRRTGHFYARIGVQEEEVVHRAVVWLLDGHHSYLNDRGLIYAIRTAIKQEVYAIGFRQIVNRRKRSHAYEKAQLGYDDLRSEKGLMRPEGVAHQGSVLDWITRGRFSEDAFLELLDFVTGRTPGPGVQRSRKRTRVKGKVYTYHYYRVGTKNYKVLADANRAAAERYFA